MNISIRVKAENRTFVVEGFSEDVGSALSSLGFTVEGHAATATRHIDRYSRHVDHAFSNFAKHLQTMLDQLSGKSGVPWEKSLTRLASKLDGSGIDWGLIGTTALAARGVVITPGDIDIVTDLEGAVRLADLYRDDLVFPVVDWPGAGLFGRAFDGARVEWLGNDGSSWTGWTLAAASETVTWEGHCMRVPPVQIQLRTEESRGRHDHVAAIRSFLADVDTASRSWG